MALVCEDARLKIERAEKHIADLQGIVGSLKDRYVSVVKMNPEGGESVFYTKCPDLKKILAEIGLIAGDAAHNLRVSLDYTWIAVRKHLGLPINKYSKFPFGETPKTLDGLLKNGQIESTSPALYKWVLSDVKPYDGGTGPSMVFTGSTSRTSRN